MLNAYLDDLDRALTGVDDDARDEILRSVDEHIDAALRQDPPADAHEILAELGPVERIIASAGVEPGLADETPTTATRGPLLALLGAAASVLMLAIATPFAFLPAAVTLVASLGARRHQPDGRYTVAAAASGAVLAVSLVLAVTLLPTGTPEPTTPEPPQEVTD